MIVGVLSVVHHADDVRIREKLIETLIDDVEVEYHARRPEPDDVTGFSYHPIGGPRLVRNLILAWRLWTRPLDVAVLVDPETFLAGVLASRRVKVVFDIHEHVPGQILTKRIPMRKVLARVAEAVLRLAERAGSVTLAEPGYGELFAKDHPVFENYPRWEALPEPQPGNGTVVYVGDVTEQRGALDLAAAVGPTGMPLMMVGRCSTDLADRINKTVRDLGGTVELTGRLPWRTAMERLASASVAVSPLRDTPNYRHSLPTKVLEYVGLGVPVVATNLPGTVDVLEGLAGVRLVDPGQVEALRTAILEMANPAVREDARRSAIAIRAGYSWPTARVRRFYAELAGFPGIEPVK